MRQLAIRVRGEVLSSNFDEWKLELIANIQASNFSLTTDAEFAQAQSDVKNFKTAEKALEKAKESAISQAGDIQRLFSAIDEVSAEVRRVRLSLERQIRLRKETIKEEFVDLGIAKIRKYIELQGPEFRSLDHSRYLQREAFADALRYRSNINALHGAIDDACARIKTQIDAKVVTVQANHARLARLPSAHQALFQDRSELLALPTDKLDEVIDKRLAFLEQQVEGGRRGGPIEPPGYNESDDERSNEPDVRSTYSLTIELSATLSEADEFFRQLRLAYSGNPLIRTMQLARM